MAATTTGYRPEIRSKPFSTGPSRSRRSVSRFRCARRSSSTSTRPSRFWPIRSTRLSSAFGPGGSTSARSAATTTSARRAGSPATSGGTAARMPTTWSTTATSTTRCGPTRRSLPTGAAPGSRPAGQLHHRGNGHPGQLEKLLPLAKERFEFLQVAASPLFHQHQDLRGIAVCSDGGQVPALEGGEIVDQPLRQGHDLQPKLLDVANPVRTDALDPCLSASRVTQLAGAVVMAALSRDLLRLHVAARPDRAEWPVIGVDHDGMPRLIGRTIVELRRERLRIRARIARSFVHLRPSQLTH